MVISRKKNLFLFLVILTIISVSPVTIAGVNFWDVAENQIFFRGSGDGPITLHDVGTASQIQIVNGVVEFTDLTIGAGSIEFVGFNASANANLTALAVGAGMIAYNIDANNGVTTVTTIKVPPFIFDVDVEGEDSFTFNDTTDLVTVQETHGPDTKQIIIYFNRSAEVDWVLYNLTEIGVTVGTLDAGNLASTLEIDGDMYNVSEVMGAPGMQISGNFSGVDPDAECLWVVIYAYYDGNLNHDFDIEVWNFTGSAWVEDSHITDGTELEWFNSTIYPLRIPNEFLSGGEVRVRLDHEAPGNINHDLFIEYFKLLAEIPSGPSVLAGAVITQIFESDFPWLAIAIILMCVAYLLFRPK